jgi:radical SAM superfamily enzyme YgiQ (UPF0313 family)
MHYEGNIIRPPSEANSILLQVTLGCSHNKCTFCGTYLGKRFKIKSEKIIQDDLVFAARHFKRQRRVFLCDGDALIVPQARLIKILQEIRGQLPWVTRIGAYANAKSIKMKSLEQLNALKALGLGIIYMGLETGDDVTLKKIHKGTTAQEMVEQGKKVKAAGIKLSVTVLVGIAGISRSEIHAKETGRALSAMDPDYIGALSLMLIPGTPLHADFEAGRFSVFTPQETLLELRTMIENTNLSRGLFHANHASNYLPLKARLPEEKAKTLRLIHDALAGKHELKPEWMRAL